MIIGGDFMSGIFGWYNGVILKKYNEDTDFVLFKKAQFVSLLALAAGFSMLILLLVAVLFSHDLLIRSYKLAIALILASTVTMSVTAAGKVMWAANFMAFASLIMEMVGFNLRPPHLAGVTMGYYFYQTVVFSTLFCSTIVSLSIIIIILGTHFFYYITVASKVTEGILVETGRMTMVDGSITLVTVYLVCVATASFLNKAIEKTGNESRKNLEQYNDICHLMDAIHGASELLAKSIDDTSSEILSLSDNAQNQAASVEELAATMEEISAGSVNVGHSTREQGESIRELVSSIEQLSSLIGVLEKNGHEISQSFLGLMKNASEGEKTTARLDEINNMISSNSSEIQTVVNIMTDFFDRINLLSLNAAIEAARAGEHGRGFAVVASEIGKLADNSAREANQISKLIEKNKADVDAGNRVITEIIAFIHSLVSEINGMQTKAVGVLKGIRDQKNMNDDMNGKTNIVKEKTEQISQAMKEQETAIESVVVTIENTNGAIQNMATSVGNLRHSSESLKKLADDLDKRFAKN